MDNASPILAFVQRGFHETNSNILAAIIALVVVIAFMKEWRQLFPMVVLALVAHVLINFYVVPLVSHGAPHGAIPPVVDPGFWMNTLSLGVGYLIILVVLFFLKKNIFKMG